MFFRGIRLLAASLSLLSVVLALPAANSTASSFEIYHSVSGAEHANRTKSLTDRGYRIISLSSYGGSASDAQYAAVWVNQQGKSQEFIEGVDADAFSAWWQSWKAKGYLMTHVSATGSNENAVFTGVMEDDNDSTRWQLVCDMQDPWAFANATMGVDMSVNGFRMYGTPEERRYCILGHENVNNYLSTIFYTTPKLGINYTSVYESEIKKPFWRPSRLYLSDDQVITPAFVDTNVGSWVVRHSLTAEELDQEVKAQVDNGLHPISIEGGGHGPDVRFTAVFVETDSIEPRQWTVRGSLEGFEDNKAAQERIDYYFEEWMRRNGVRQAQFSVARNGSTLAERSYTWAEANRAVVEPKDTFLLGSLTKMFTNEAIYQLVQAGTLNYTTTVFPLLGIKPTDERANDITVRDLLEHKGGWDRAISGDPSFDFYRLSLKLFNGERAVGLADFVEWMATLTLDFDPGSYEAYSNTGTMLMSYIVTNVTGTPYLDYLKENVFDGLDVKLYETDLEAHKNDRIIQESKLSGKDPVHPWLNMTVPGPTGGDGAVKEETMGAFSLAASASSIARFIGSHAVWGYGARQPSYTRDGSVVGARGWAASWNDLDWSVVLNTREYKGEDQWSDLVSNKIPWFLEDFPVAA